MLNFFLQIEDMDHFFQNPYFCSQLKEVIHVENLFGSYSAFQSFSNQFEEHRVEERIEKEGDKEKNNVEIIAT